MRLRSEIWVQAYLRRVRAAGAAGYVMRRGDGDAGAILITISAREGAALYVPAIAPDGDPGERLWSARVSMQAGSEAEIARLIEREASMDPDIWVIEVEDRDGRHFLLDKLAG